MLRGVNLHRLLEGQGRADGVRAGGELVPAHTAHEANISGRLQRSGIPFCLENHARWIGQDHDGPRLRQSFADLIHDRRARINHITVRLGAFAPEDYPDFEAPLVDLQSLDLRLQRRRRHTESRRGAEWSGHSALAFRERRLDGVLFVVRQRADGGLMTGGVSRVRPESHRASIESVSESHTITARSMTFCSSRMLPGQSYD